MTTIKLSEYGLERKEDGSIESASNFPDTIRAEDIGKKLGDKLDCIIREAEEVDFDNGKKIVVSLEIPKLAGKDDDGIRRLILNKTNLGRLAAKHGDDLEAWYGESVTLVREDTTFRGERVECVRIAY